MHTNPSASRRSGFTLIEVLVVLGIIAILAAVVLVALNPARQFAEARNTQRTSNVATLLNAAGQRMAENRGVFAGDFDVGSSTYACPPIPQDGTARSIAKNGIDLSCLTPTYIPSGLPVDPSGDFNWSASGAYDIGYSISSDSLGRITVSAPHAELGATIMMTR